MVKENIIDTKARKGIHNSAQYRKVLIADITPQKSISTQSGKGEFYHEQRRHEIRYDFTGERHGNPEERTAEHIEAIGTDNISAEVSRIAPSDITVPYRIMYHLIERNLLYIIISVEEKVSDIPDHPGQKKSKCQPQSP